MDLAVRVLRHIREVRRMDEALASARALVVIENNYTDWITDRFSAAMDDYERNTSPTASGIGTATAIAVGSSLNDDRVTGVQLLDLDIALREIASGSASRSRSEAELARKRMQRAILMPDVAPADMHGVQKRGARTTPTMKPLMCDLLRRLLHDGRIVLHRHMVALVSPTVETLEAFLDRTAGHAGAAEISAVLARAGVSTAGTTEEMLRRLATAPRGSAGADVMASMAQAHRDAVIEMLMNQFRGFREHHDLEVRRDGRVDETIYLTGKRRQGPHEKKDDLVSSPALLVYSILCVAELAPLAHIRRSLRMESGRSAD